MDHLVSRHHYPSHWSPRSRFEDLEGVSAVTVDELTADKWSPHGPIPQ
jgi:hypothetical protein